LDISTTVVVDTHVSVRLKQRSRSSKRNMEKLTASNGPCEGEVQETSVKATQQTSRRTGCCPLAEFLLHQEIL
jgi:hypothetical protein